MFTISQNSLYRGSLYQGLSVLVILKDRALYWNDKVIKEMKINILFFSVPDDVLFLTQQQQQQQQQLQQQRQSQTSTPDVALQSQMISHRMQVTSSTGQHHSTSSASQRSSYHHHQPQPQHPRASQVSSVRLSNISSGGSSDLDSRKCSLN